MASRELHSGHESRGGIMSNSLADKYVRWFEYEKDAHAKVLASLDAVPRASCSSSSYTKALSLMGHIIAARRLWLFRLGGLNQAPTDFFPTDVDTAGLRRQLGETENAWDSYLQGLDDQKISITFEYKSMEGRKFRNTV